MGKAFCERKDAGFDKNVVVREDKFMSRVVGSRRKDSPFLGKVVQCHHPALPVHMGAVPYEGISVGLCSLQVGPSTVCYQINLGRPLSLSKCITFIPTSVTTLLRIPLSKEINGW